MCQSTPSCATGKECSGRRKFGRIFRRLCIGRSRHHDLESPVSDASRDPGVFPAVNVRTTMRKNLLALILLSVSVSTGALAQQQRSGTPEEQKACTRDVQRHCRTVIDQGDLVILSCLQQNRAKISAACDQVLKSHGQ